MSGGVDYGDIVKYLGYLLMALLSFLSLKLWNDVDYLKKTHIAKPDFDKAIADLKAETKAERDSKHTENTGNFKRLEDLITKNHDLWNRDYREISSNLAQVRITQAAQGASLQIERRNLQRHPETEG